MKIIDKYYLPQPELREILLTHSEMVARKALDIIHRKGLEMDEDFVWEAAMLHDIGIIHTDAPGIKCFGTLPYICHGTEGRKMLDAEGMPRHALVCERHTGAGLTVEDIVRQKLPLPMRDMTPKTPEERLICYADKFYSKSGDLRYEKPVEKIRKSMLRHGEDSLVRFNLLHEEFGE